MYELEAYLVLHSIDYGYRSPEIVRFRLWCQIVQVSNFLFLIHVVQLSQNQCGDDLRDKVHLSHNSSINQTLSNLTATLTLLHHQGLWDISCQFQPSALWWKLEKR